MLHEQFEGGLGRCIFDPPVYFEIRGHVDPPEKQVFHVQECGDMDVPMKVVQLEGWPVTVMEDSLNASTTPPGNNALPPPYG